MCDPVKPNQTKPNNPRGEKCRDGVTAVLQDKTQQDLMFPSPVLLLSFSGVYTRRWATLPEDEHGQIYGRVSEEV